MIENIIREVEHRASKRNDDVITKVLQRIMYNDIPSEITEKYFQYLQSNIIHIYNSDKRNELYTILNSIGHNIEELEHFAKLLDKEITIDIEEVEHFAKLEKLDKENYKF